MYSKNPRFFRSTSVFVLTLVLATTSWAQGREKVIHVFHGPSVKFPTSGLIADPSGNLFGVTKGAAYELSPAPGDGFTYQVIALMPGGVGDDAQGNLVRDALGNLYGATNGGNSNCGYVYELTPHSGAAWTFQILKSFDCINGGRAGFTMAMDASGNLYGASTAGGTGQFSGLVSELSPAAGGQWTYKILHQFSLAEGNPQTGLILDTAGSLYGATGSRIFKLTPSTGSTWTTRILYQFNESVDGSLPFGDLTLDSAGNVFGTNETGGEFFNGTAFKVTPSSGGGTLTVLHAFGSTDDGETPFGGLTRDAAGNLYGTTAAGNGSSQFGTVFKLSLVGGDWQETILYRFAGLNGNDGAQPRTSLYLNSNTLYGTTEVGGDPACLGAGGCGTVFAIR